MWLEIIRKWTVLLLLNCLYFFAVVQPIYALVWIWDGIGREWTTTLSDGTPIDTTLAEDATEPSVAVDSRGNTYVAFRQNDTEGTNIGRIYLSRYRTTGEVQIWDNDERAWTTELSEGDPIDTGIAGLSAQSPQVAVDASDRVYVVFAQSDGNSDRIYLSRYNGTHVTIYGPGIWTPVFANGQPIDANTGLAAKSPQLAVDNTVTNQVYVTFFQNNGSENHIYLSRYNGTDVRIWDAGDNNWVTNFRDGDPIDTSLVREADSPKIAIDSADRVYVAYRQIGDDDFNIFLSRYSDADALQIWDTDVAEWTIILNNGDPIGFSEASGDALGPELAIDSENRVYLVYAQQKTGTDRIFMSRYNETEVQIWSGTWRSDAFNQAQPIDTGETKADGHQVIADSNDMIYVAFGQLTDGINRIHLTRWNGTDIEIWNSRVPQWTTTLFDGRPIDAATGQAAIAFEMAVDSSHRVYIAFHQLTDLAARIYLSRYEDTGATTVPTLRIWNQTEQSWTTEFTNGDPIDAGSGGSASFPKLAADPSDNVFVTYSQNDGVEDHIYLNNYERFGREPNQPSNGEDDSSCFISTIGVDALFSPSGITDPDVGAASISSPLIRRLCAERGEVNAILLKCHFQQVGNLITAFGLGIVQNDGHKFLNHISSQSQLREGTGQSRQRGGRSGPRPQCRGQTADGP
jgi:hypothetical protein